MRDEQAIARQVGLSPDEAGAQLEQLALLGLIVLPEDASSDPPPPPPVAPPPGTAPSPTAPSPSLAGAATDAVDLEEAKQRRVDDLWDRLDDLTYYELLGVGHDADKKQVKSAYYALAPEFHPDTYFRRQLGPFRAKIEAIFGRITLAHDVLTTPARRAEYDAYLDQTQANLSTQAILEQAPADVEAILADVARAAAEAAARAASVASVAPAPSLSPEEVLRQRREALARKLAGGRGLPRASSAPVAATRAPVAPDPDAALRAAEAMQQRQEAALAEAKRAHLAKYLDAGRAALENKEWSAAANSYRIAASLEPDDAEVQAACNEALKQVAVALADGYWKQGIYEEGQERWADAALSYSKVCAGKPDSAPAHERVAYTTLKSSTNYRRAVEFARRAIELDPKKAEYRITLARAYKAAGLEKSAASELDRALEAAPKDAKIVALVTQARAALSVTPAPPPATSAPAPSPNAPLVDHEHAPAPERTPAGISGLMSRFRSALAPKEGK